MTNQEKTDLRKALDNGFYKLTKTEQEKFLAAYNKNPIESINVIWSQISEPISVNFKQN